MAFYTPPKPIEYKPDSRIRPCSVIVSYTPDGLVKPMYIQYQDSNEENITLKVDSVQPYKNTLFAISITCLVIVEDRLVERK